MTSWLEILRAECSRTSQHRTAQRLGVSGSMINQVLKGVYKGNTGRLEALVRGELLKETLSCPVLGDISKKRCLDEQGRPFAPTNPMRISVFKCCRNGCPNSSIGRKENPGT